MHEFPCTLLSWHDGDTCRVLVDLDIAGLTMHRVVRVHGIDTPELNCDAGLAAKEAAEFLAPVGTTITCRTAKRRECDSFGRWLAVVKLPGGREFAAAMIEAGHGKAYYGDYDCEYDPFGVQV